MTALIKDSQKLLKVDKKALKGLTENLLASSGLQDRDLSILLVDNGQIRAYNAQFFGRDRPTNVISFSYIDGPPHEVVGDIIVSVERAREEAEAAGVPFFERLCALIIHGFVHVLGFDHEKDPREARRMRYRENKYLKLLLADPLYGKVLEKSAR